MGIGRDEVVELAKSIQDELVQIRRTIHANPELAFQEHETSAYILKQLNKLDIPTTHVARTGLLGIVEGADPGSCVALRADIDALPIQEETGLPFASKNPGVMHACGHDAHTTMAIGAARILTHLRSRIPGSVKLLFQPSEELLPGGAPSMIEDGVLKDPEVKAIMGQHVMPLQRSGTFGFCSGPMMASADELYITMRGKSGHAAIPQKAIDPIVASSEMVIALQKIVSRKLDPFSQGVLSITSINGGDSTNIIPDEVVMKGTLRSTDEEWRNDAHGMIEEIVHATARGNGCEADLEIRRGYPVLVTDHLVTEKAHRYANEIYGESDSFTALPLMVAEDFSYYLREVPGTFWWIGAGEVEQGCIAGLHNSTFTIDEEILWRGAAMMAWSACRFLEEEAQPGDG